MPRWNCFTSSKKTNITNVLFKHSMKMVCFVWYLVKENILYMSKKLNFKIIKNYELICMYKKSWIRKESTVYQYRFCNFMNVFILSLLNLIDYHIKRTLSFIKIIFFIIIIFWLNIFSKMFCVKFVRNAFYRLFYFLC